MTDRHHVIPWARSELATVSLNGHAYHVTYRWRGEEMILELPGGRALSVKDMRERGYKVTMPKHIRARKEMPEQA